METIYSYTINDTQRFRVYEMRANQKAARYFGDYFGVDWNTPYKDGTYDTYFPQHNRIIEKIYQRRLSGPRLIRR